MSMSAGWDAVSCLHVGQHPSNACWLHFCIQTDPVAKVSKMMMMHANRCHVNDIVSWPGHSSGPAGQADLSFRASASAVCCSCEASAQLRTASRASLTAWSLAASADSASCLYTGLVMQVIRVSQSGHGCGVKVLHSAWSQKRDVAGWILVDPDGILRQAA